MANPLAILGQIGAGLSTVGAGGAGGALHGALEGEGLARKFQSEDELNKLRALQALQMQQSLGPQFKVDPHGRIYQDIPGQPPKFIDFMPTPPQTSLQRQQEDTSRMNEARYQKQIEQMGDEKAPTPTTILGKIQQKAITQGRESLSPVELDIYDRQEKGAKEPTGLQGWTARANDPRVSAEDRAVAKQIADSILKAEMQRVGTTAQTHADISEGVKKRAEERKADKGLAVTTTLLNQMDALIPALQKKGFLAADDSAEARWQALAKRSKYVPFYGKPGDPDLVAWEAKASEGVIILRNLGDVGARTKAAFQSVIDLFHGAPTETGLKQALSNLRDQVKAQKTGEEQNIPANRQGASGGSAGAFPPLPDPSTMPGQTVKWEPTGELFKSDGAKWDRVQKGAPAGAGTDPGATAGLPKGAHLEGGEIISDSGKYVWKGGAWQAR